MHMHHCDRFSSNPKSIHERAVTKIVRCLIDTIYCGHACKVDLTKRLDFFDADFAGGWNAIEPLNSSSVLSRTGFSLNVQDCQIYGAANFKQNITFDL